MTDPRRIGGFIAVSLKHEVLEFMRGHPELGSLRRHHVSQHFKMSDEELRQGLANQGVRYRDLLETVRDERLKKLVREQPFVDGRMLRAVVGFNSSAAFGKFFQNLYGVPWSQARAAGWPEEGWKNNL